MTHDFAKKTKPARKKTSASSKPPAAPPRKSQVPGWVWLFTGIVTGVFISFLAWLADIVPANDGTSPIVEKTRAVAEQASTEITTRFDFYTLLPEREILVPEEVDDSTEAVEQFHYILQAGSFKSAADADRLRARLLLLGLEASMEPVTGRNGETWHRVQVGPFVSRSKLAKARSTLISEGIDTLLLKRKRDDA